MQAYGSSYKIYICHPSKDTGTTDMTDTTDTTDTGTDGTTDTTDTTDTGKDGTDTTDTGTDEGMFRDKMPIPMLMGFIPSLPRFKPFGNDFIQCN